MKRYNSLENIIPRKKSPRSQLTQVFIINKHPRVLFHLHIISSEFHKISLAFIRMAYI